MNAINTAVLFVVHTRFGSMLATLLFLLASVATIKMTTGGVILMRLPYSSILSFVFLLAQYLLLAFATRPCHGQSDNIKARLFVAFGSAIDFDPQQDSPLGTLRVRSEPDQIMKALSAIPKDLASVIKRVVFEVPCKNRLSYDALSVCSELEYFSCTDRVWNCRMNQIIPALPKISYLEVSGTEFDDDAIHAVSRMKSLRAINILRTSVSPEGIECLSRLKSLNQLLISDAHLGSCKFEFFRHCQEMVWVSLENTKAKDVCLQVTVHSRIFR